MKRIRVDQTVIVLGILVVVIIVGAILVATVGRSFFSPGNIRDILTGMSVLGLVAIGQTLVILGASLDLSVIVRREPREPHRRDDDERQPGQHPVGRGAHPARSAPAIGLANGLIVTVLKVNGFIATLGVGLILQGVLNTNFQGSAGSVPWEFQSDRRDRRRPRAGLDDHHDRPRGARMVPARSHPHRRAPVRRRRRPRGRRASRACAPARR